MVTLRVGWVCAKNCFNFRSYSSFYRLLLCFCWKAVKCKINIVADFTHDLLTVVFLSFFSLSSLTSLCSQNENTDVAHLYSWVQHYTSITSTLFQYNLFFFLFFKHAVLVSCTSESQNLLHRRQKEKFRSLIEARKSFLQYLQDILEFSLSFAKTQCCIFPQARTPTISMLSAFYDLSSASEM